LYYYIKIENIKIILYLHIQDVYKCAYELKQTINDNCKIEIWQNIDDVNTKLCTIVKKANPPTYKKKYDKKTGISFTSKL